MRNILIPAMALLGLAAFVSSQPSIGAETAVHAPAPKLVIPATARQEVAYFAGGCFWGVEGVFEHVKGVTSAVSGYSGGTTPRPTYEQVSTGRTGHAETVRVTYDPTKVSYAKLLQVYFSVVADPTLLNRQGPDTGTQYRAALFPVNVAQARQAKAYIAQLTAAKTFNRPIVTRLEKFGGFTPAESYHQDFMRNNPNYPYIVINDRPKVEALKQLYPALYQG